MKVLYKFAECDSAVLILSDQTKTKRLKDYNILIFCRQTKTRLKQFQKTKTKTKTIICVIQKTKTKTKSKSKTSGYKN